MITLRLPANMESLGHFRSFVLSEMEREGDLQELTPQVDLVLEEILVNVIHYAYEKGKGEIEVECGAEAPGTFRVTVTDWGKAFNPLDQADPDLSASIDDRGIGGLGIHLAKHMASRLNYERRNGGNILTLWFEKKEQ